MGVLVRVQDDNNYYRITFASEVTGATTNRAKQGMSVQKVLNGSWSELFSEVAPAYIFPFSARSFIPDHGRIPMVRRIRKSDRQHSRNSGH